MAMSAEKLARKTGKGSKKAKDNGEKAKAAKVQAEEIIEKVQAAVSEDHALGHKTKELRDRGLAWWAIAYELKLPGSGPNVASGKAGAARARSLYKKTFGELPGDKAQRSTKAQRVATATGEAPVVRRCVFSAAVLDPEAPALADEEIIGTVVGKKIRWVGRMPYGAEDAILTEREARVHPHGVKVVRHPDRPATLHFREQDQRKVDRRAEQWRAVYLQDVYDIRP